MVATSDGSVLFTIPYKIQAIFFDTNLKICIFICPKFKWYYQDLYIFYYYMGCFEIIFKIILNFTYYWENSNSENVNLNKLSFRINHRYSTSCNVPERRSCRAASQDLLKVINVSCIMYQYTSCTSIIQYLYFILYTICSCTPLLQGTDREKRFRNGHHPRPLSRAKRSLLWGAP